MNNLQAFLDQKDYILIVSPNKSSFKINGDFLNAKFLNASDGIYYYEALYSVDLSNYYLIEDDFNNSTLLEVRYYVKSDMFDKEFFYDKNDLGSTYSKENTIFKLWAPLAQKVNLKYSHNNIENIVEMKRKSNGVFECTINDDIKIYPNFSPIFMNDVLEIDNSFTDIKEYDPGLYKNLVDLKNYEGDVENDLCLTFSVIEEDCPLC